MYRRGLLPPRTTLHPRQERLYDYIHMVMREERDIGGDEGEALLTIWGIGESPDGVLLLCGETYPLPMLPLAS